MDSNVKSTGEEIFRLMEDESASIFNKDWWYGQIMDWSMRNEHFKVQMFRFVDVLPYLNSSSEVARHLKEYFAESGDNLPSVFNFGLGLGSLAPGLMAGAIRKNVTQMAKMFIAGESPQEALPQLQKAREKNIAFTVDLLGEATLSDKEALEYQRKYIELIEWLAKESRNWPEIPVIDRNHLGPIPKVNVSVKLSALHSQINLKDWDPTKEKLKERLRPVLQIAKEHGVFINLDMEQYSLKNLTLEVFQEIISEPSFKTYPHWGIVIQGYLKDALADIKKLVEVSKKRGVPFTIRLVKGAYWDYELVDSQQKNWDIPVYTNKKATDANFEKCAELLLENHKYIFAAIASHNVRSIAACIVKAKKLGIPLNSFEVQMLYGMADPIKKALTKMGLRLRQYTPIGELIPGMAYLVRRLLENTSNESFLRSKFADNVSTEKLLEDPASQLQNSPTSDNGATSTASIKKRDFENEALLDFTIPENRSSMAEAVQNIIFKTPVPLFIGGKEVKTDRYIESLNPSHPSQVIGKVCMANTTHAELALQSAETAFKTWSTTPAETRAQYLDRVADVMVERKFELSALQVLEVGKNWTEADGDVAEAIDFCRFYAKEMRRLGRPHRVGHAPGEVSMYHYRPRGVSLVVAPWNFPLAILTGMVGAALVTGNTVIFKPAEQSSLVGAQLCSVLREAGLPAGVFQFLPGHGSEVGEYLVNSSRVSTIAFTGSRDVGLKIIEKASRHQPGQNFVKRCLVEMGGKNAIIVDSDADLDEAVNGVLYSAFGFQGQKCSACSRVIVLDEIYERFTERLVEAVKSIKISFAEDPACVIGPVVDKEAQERILRTISENRAKFKVLFQGETPNEGFFVPPTIFGDVDSSSSLAQEEIFGPVLAVIRAKSIDQALEFANSTQYALTGGVYSRSPENIEKVRFSFEVGNLYINRGITGALVERHPFGGFKLSGAGSKTGGPDYLLHFVDPRVVTENTMRRGFAPIEDEPPAS